MKEAKGSSNAQDDGSSSISAPPYDMLPDQIGPYGISTWQNSIARAADDGRVSLDLRHGLSQLSDSLREQYAREPIQLDQGQTLRPTDRSPPPLNIVMQVVGSQGDVQPFVALGVALQNYGHRVRVATHPQFRQFVKNYGLEFFSIGGDPAELMAFMVKNPGLMPKFATFRQGEVQKRRRTMRDIMHACWRSCYELTDGTDDTEDHDAYSKPFVAGAIIANPPSFAHIHCAEKLGIPLHMVFTMPWSPTRQFPHPLVNINAPEADANLANFLSYFLIDAMIWQGLGDIINRFRHRVLELEPIDPTQAPGFMRRLRVPHTYCWSPFLVPKPSDWPPTTTVSGYVFLPTPDAYNPPTALLEFLKTGPLPIYIGFGSIVVDDPSALTKIVLEAVRIAGVRAIICQGWGHLGESATAPAFGSSSATGAPDYHDNPNVFLLSACPHHWLFPRVSCVVHHGGAGTTAAGLAAGKPTVIVPFFGDQQFWGNMVCRYGAGPQPIPYKDLSAEKLAAAIVCATTDEDVGKHALQLQEQISKEQGLEKAVASFHACLPDSIFAGCGVVMDRVAIWRYTKKHKNVDAGVDLGAMAVTTLRKEKLLDWDDVKLHRHVEYGVAHFGPQEPFSGAVLAVGDLFYDTFRGMGEICYEFLGMPVAGSVGVWKKNRRDAEKTSQISNPEYTTQMIADGFDLTKSTSVRQPPNSLPHMNTGGNYIPGKYAYNGTVRIGKAAARAPGAFTVAMARGAHNVPKLWGDRTVRSQEKVTGIGSGMKEGVKELAFGVSDGISGLFIQPVIGFVEAGPVGFVKGIGKGVLGLPVKFFAASAGIVGYPLKGIDVSITNAMRGPDHGLKTIRHGRMLQGEMEYLEASDAERKAVVEWWDRYVLRIGK